MLRWMYSVLVDREARSLLNRGTGKFACDSFSNN
jgi:hypothetical protein